MNILRDLPQSPRRVDVQRVGQQSAYAFLLLFQYYSASHYTLFVHRLAVRGLGSDDFTLMIFTTDELCRLYLDAGQLEFGVWLESTFR